MSSLFYEREHDCWVHWINEVQPRLMTIRGGHRHLQIGRMLDIDLISEPPHAPSPQMYANKVWEAIHSWGLRMSHISPCTPCSSPQGYRSKVESRHFAHHWWQSRESVHLNAWINTRKAVRCMEFASIPYGEGQASLIRSVDICNTSFVNSTSNINRKFNWIQQI
jgi:hypothetical protein